MDVFFQRGRCVNNISSYCVDGTTIDKAMKQEGSAGVLWDVVGDHWAIQSELCLGLSNLWLCFYPLTFIPFCFVFPPQSYNSAFWIWSFWARCSRFGLHCKELWKWAPATAAATHSMGIGRNGRAAGVIKARECVLVLEKSYMSVKYIFWM